MFRWLQIRVNSNLMILYSFDLVIIDLEVVLRSDILTKSSIQTFVQIK